MGDEEEVMEAIQALENARIVTNVSPVYPNRGDKSKVRVYSEEIYTKRLSEALWSEVQKYKDAVYGNGAAGWYCCVRCGYKDTPREGPFRSEKEAKERAEEIASELRKQGKQCFEIWEQCDKEGIPLSLL